MCHNKLHAIDTTHLSRILCLNPFDLAERCRRRNRFTIQVFICTYVYSYPYTGMECQEVRHGGSEATCIATPKRESKTEKLHCEVSTGVELFRGVATSCGNYAYDLVRIKFPSNTLSFCVCLFCLFSFCIGSTGGYFLFIRVSCFCSFSFFCYILCTFLFLSYCKWY